MIAIKEANKFTNLLTKVNTLFSSIEDGLGINKKNISLRTLQSMNIGVNKYKVKQLCLLRSIS